MKTTQLFFLGLILWSSTLFAGQPEGVTKPQFPGGDKALVQFLEDNLKYPEEAQKNKWEGKTLVAFTVNEDGSLSNIRVMKSSWVSLDTEALRIVKMMPKWVPASDNGIPKKEMVVLPVSFDLKIRKNYMY